MEPITLYNPKDWKVTIGVLTVFGFGDGDAIELTPPEEETMAKEGVMGDVGFAVADKRLHKLTLRLMQSSRCNRLLREMQKAQRLPTMRAPTPASVVNVRTGEAYRGSGLFVAAPAQKASNEVPLCEWVFLFVVDPITGYTAGV